MIKRFLTKKTSILSVVFVVLALGTMPFLASAATTAAAAAKKVPFYYGAWIPFWQAQAGEENIAVNLDSLNEVSPFSYDVNSNGTLVDDLNIGSGIWNGWFSAVSELGVKIIPTIAWFDGTSINNLLSNTKKRQAEENTIAALVKANKFDGIDIDFEGMVPATKPYFSLFIEGLAIRLHPMGKVLTCTAVPRTPAASLAGGIASDSEYSEDYTVLNQYCDEVRVMAYDQETVDTTLDATKGNGNLYAPVADPDWVSSVLTETLKTISPKKIMLGIPTYGYEYEVAWNQGVTSYTRVRAFDFTDAMDRADSLGIEPTRNNADELSFTYASTTYIEEPPSLVSTIFSTQPAELAIPNPNATTTFFVTFPDSKSIQDEINLAKKDGLRGAMLYKADGDIDPATWAAMTH